MNGRLPLLLTFLLVAPVAAQDYSATMILCRWDITSSVIAGDLNGDAAPDLIFGNGRHYPERSLIYFNDGSGWLLGEHPLFAVTRKTYRIGLGDFDQDGDLDAVEVTDFGDFNQIFWNNGSGIFSAGPTLGGQQFQGGRLLASRDVDVADLDGDGWVDIVVATRESGPSLVLLNRKAGTEWEVLSLGEPGPSIRVATADLDSDGDIDIVLGRRGPNQIWWNDGNKTFRSVTLEGPK